MNSRKIILAKNPKLANSRNSRKFLPKISRIFPLAKVSSAKVSSFKVIATTAPSSGSKEPLVYLLQEIENKTYQSLITQVNKQHLTKLIKLIGRKIVNVRVNIDSQRISVLCSYFKHLIQVTLLKTAIPYYSGGKKHYWTSGKFCSKVPFPRYTESVKFSSQSRETASKRKPYRGLGY